jgi:2-polyprenyl-3-methyl-5-hydroxy-6-metoxy-1,4-benzoquinol methylase
VNDDPNPRRAAENAAYYGRLWRAHGTRLNSSERARAAFLAHALGKYVGAPCGEILDLGCGRGWLAPLLSAFGSVTGVDFSPEGIAMARREYGPHAEFLPADPADATLGLPPERRFDVVVSSEVIEHVEDQGRYVDLVLRLLKPGGWLLLTTPNGNVFDEFCRHRRQFQTLQPIEKWLTPARLSQLLRAKGFEVKLHVGLPVPSCRLGRRRWLQGRAARWLFARLGMAERYGRWLVLDALNQGVVARKSATSSA